MNSKPMVSTWRLKQLKTDEFLAKNQKQDLENGKEFELWGQDCDCIRNQ
ncbi:unnamed protein product [Lactuca saligna]|uniref:Uncharacterized protein n=1 Tax=Lactuca saligna TaxID=75948 RepID=A0AA35ZP81_LACSI|nr:unnamed protein product [Lactuca saligna]